MKNKLWRKEFAVGLMVIVGMVLLSILLITASNWRFSGGGSDIKIRFDYVGGLIKSAPVHIYGVEVGKVKSVDLVEDYVQVTAHVREDVAIREGYEVHIDILGVVGEKYLEIINGPVRNPATDDDPLIGVNPVSVGQVMARADEITTKTLKTIDFVQNFINRNEKDIHDSVTELRDFIVKSKDMLQNTMGNVDVLLERVNNLTEAAECDICLTLGNLKTFTEGLNEDRAKISSLVEGVTDDLDQLMSNTTLALENSVGNLEEVSADLRTSTKKASQHIDNLSESASHLIAQLSDIAASGDESLKKGLEDFSESAAAINEIADKIDSLVTQIENGEGTLGKLITDDQGYSHLNEAIAKGKRAAEDVSDMTSSMNRKVKFLDDFGMRKEYGLSYNNISRSLQNEIAFSLAQSDRYFLTSGLSVRKGKPMYDIQLGRKFGKLTARAGAIRSEAGVGLDYWPLPRRMGLSLEGIDITDKTPELDLNVAVKVFGGLYFVFGAEDLAGSEIGFNLGLKAISGN